MDSDGDGVPDVIDIDDDGDGILDMQELEQMVQTQMMSKATSAYAQFSLNG
jgi:hypothetical protein